MRLEDVFYSVAISDKKIKSSAIQPGGTYPVVDQGKEFIAGYSNEGENLVRIPGPVIIFGDHTCGVKFVDFDFVPGADGIKVLRPICCHEQYFYWVLRSVKVEERGYSRHFKYLLQHQFPLPPLAEQRRIVAKVDELMALCDELAARQQARHAARAQLQQSALHHLLAARDPHTFVPAWQRVRDNFHLLHDTPDAIPQLRQAILQLAVQGRLVPQNPKDEPASVLFEKIQKARSALAAAGEIRKPGDGKSVVKDEELYPLPASWMWCRLEAICTQITDGTHFTPTYLPQGVPFLSVKDVTGGKIDFSRVKYISRAEHEELTKRCKPDYLDILFTKVGTTGIARVIDTQEEFSIFVSLALLKFPRKCIDPHFLELLLNSPVVRQQSADNTQGVGNKNLVLKFIKAFVVPIPPLAEQKRIVARVEALLRQCDALEAQLHQTRTVGAQLLDAALHHILAA